MKKYNRPYVEIINAYPFQVICDSDPLQLNGRKGDGQLGNSGNFDEEEVTPTTQPSFWDNAE